LISARFVFAFTGGALVNMSGQLVGINTAIISRTGGYQGIGFAIPSNMARPIMNSLLTHGEVVRGWLGVMIQNVTPELAKGLELPVDSGVLISDVAPGSPADKAGLQRDDVVLGINGEDMPTSDRLRNRIAGLAPGTVVDMRILRDGKERTVKVTLGKLEEEAAAGAATGQSGKGLLSGLDVTELTPATRARFRIPEAVKRGVVVTRVARGSQAHIMGVRAGDVIQSINRKPVNSIADFRKRTGQLQDSVVLLVSRGGRTLYLALRR